MPTRYNGSTRWGKLELLDYWNISRQVLVLRMPLCHQADNPQDWDPIISEVIRALPNVEAYPLQSSPWMRDLVRDDAVAFVGDAAHRKRDSAYMGCLSCSQLIALQQPPAPTVQAAPLHFRTSERSISRFGGLIGRA